MTKNKQDHSSKKHPKKNIALICVGVFFCLVGISLYVSFMPILASLSPAAKTAVLGGGALFVIWGIATFVFRRKEFVLNLNISLMSLVIVTPLAGELFIRAAINLKMKHFRDADLYADGFSDDNYWKLHYKWSPQPLSRNRFEVDPLLGWRPKKTADNPLGVVSDEPYTPDFGEETVLFYGDSFTEGTGYVPIDKRLPQQLNYLLANYEVHNYGVAAYGVDQMFLRFKESHPAFPRPYIIFGILTLDLDRVVLNVHGGAPKPRFNLENGELVLQNTPISENSAEWYTQHPVTIKSYFLAFLRRKYQSAAGGPNPLEFQNKQAEKKAINQKIIEAAVEEARAYHLPILFVIFYSQRELGYKGWREIFLKNLFEQLDVPYIDTKTLWLQQAKKRSIKIREFYLYKYYNGHPSEFGYCVTAEAIAEYFADNIAGATISDPKACFEPSTPLVYTSESAPDLTWWGRDRPSLNLRPEQRVKLPFKNPQKENIWLASFHVSKEGQIVEVQMDDKLIGVLAPQAGLEPAWTNETFKLPPSSKEIIDLKLQSIGTSTAKIARIGLFSPQLNYNSENNQALQWDAQGALMISPGQQLTLPFLDCGEPTCDFFISYLQERDRGLSIINDSQVINLQADGSTLSSDWVTVTLSLAPSEASTLSFRATGRKPALVREVGYRKSMEKRIKTQKTVHSRVIP